jgi:GlpG protein
MRVIGTLFSDATAERFSNFLTKRGIENRFESGVDATSGQTVFQIWILDEDRIDEANVLFKRFVNNPFDPLFDIPVQKEIIEEALEEKPVRKRFSSWITCFFLSLCVFVYLFDLMEQYPMRSGSLFEKALIMTPVQSALLFDLPPVVERLASFFEEHKIQPDQKSEDLTPALHMELESLMKTPYWRGVYDWVLLKIKIGDAQEAVGPLFMKIREGQIWRLFSPCLLHQDLLHILFNMIWLWVLGRPIEQRIGWWRTLLLTLFVGIVSNTVQYLISGPFFLGYSGVVMGLAGFIWMRQRLAPWEGYPLQRATVLFLGFFVLAMFVLQTLSFIVQLTTNLPFILNIANSAHIVGALAGALLGRFSYFAWRVK